MFRAASATHIQTWSECARPCMHASRLVVLKLQHTLPFMLDHLIKQSSLAMGPFASVSFNLDLSLFLCFCASIALCFHAFDCWLVIN